MSILLTHGYFLKEDEVEKKIMKPYPPLGILYISSFLEQYNITHNVFDSTFSTEEEWFNYVLTSRPQVIAFYTNLMTKVKILHLIEKLKSNTELQDIKILLGGPDISYNWENYMKYGADFLIIGEGEHSFLEFTKEFYGNHNYEKVNGLVFKNDKTEVVKTPSRTLSKDINALPFPNRSKIDLVKYLEVWKKHHGKSTLNISTQRGCPYTCQWCSTAVYGQSYRRRSPQLVVDEIEHLIQQYNPEALWFVDDVFTVSHKWISSFVDEMNKRKIKIPFECITRAERLNEKVLQQLKSIGCFKIWIGAESGSQKIIDKMDRRVKVQHVREMLIKTRNTGIETGTFVMIGYPDETEEDIEETIHHLKVSNPTHFTITKAYPIKGTALYTEIESNILNPELDWKKSTDRQIKFKTTYPEKYYHFALRRLFNEVHAHREKLKNGYSTKMIKLKTKSLIAKGIMYLYKK